MTSARKDYQRGYKAGMRDWPYASLEGHSVHLARGWSAGQWRLARKLAHFPAGVNKRIRRRAVPPLGSPAPAGTTSP